MKLINNMIMFLFLIVSILSKEYLLTIGLILLLLVAFIIRKYNRNLELVYLIFLFFSYVLGYVFDFYDRIYYFDAIVHSLFGLVASIYALPLLKFLKKYDFKNKIFNVLFIIIMTLSLAALWEMIEFIIDKMFESANLQIDLNNTMKDIISAFLFSVLYSIIYLEKPKIVEKIFMTKK